MPNWVNNTVTVTGPEEELVRFKEYIAVFPEYATDEGSHAFSFHSFITLPPGTSAKEYFGLEGTEGKETELYWYQWNTNNWNTKWDACEVDVTLASDPKGYALKTIYLSFNTAWDAPGPVYIAMAKMFPELSFEIWYEEEQGWGAQYRLRDCLVLDHRSWDIPDSHTEYTNQDKECVCSWDDDEENWYDDCPGKYETVYTIEVVTQLRIKATSEEQALRAAEAEQSGYDLPRESELVSVAYANEYRVAKVEEIGK